MAVSDVLPPEASNRSLSRRLDRIADRGTQHLIPRVCRFWQQGRCSKGADCSFAHGPVDPSPAPLERPTRKRTAVADPGSSSAAAAAAATAAAAAAGRPSKKNTWINQELARGIGLERNGIKNQTIATVPEQRSLVGEREFPGKPTQRTCRFWLEGACRYGERCNFLHSDNTVSGLALITTLKGHEGTVTGIAMLPDVAALFTVASDGKLKAWNCNTGTVSETLPLGGPANAVATGFGWIFAAVGCEVRAWSLKSSELALSGHASAEINVLVVAGSFLFAGLSSGEVCAWRFPTDGTGELVATGTLSRHLGAVTALTVAGGRVYSGSTDGSIRACGAAAGSGGGSVDVVVSAHAGEVTGLLCWESFLLSCSLDGSIKVWAATPAGSLENYFTYPEGEFGRSGATGMCGTVDADGKPVVACSYNDSTVRVYSLPSFEERGCLFSKTEVVSLVAMAGNSLVFSGDKEGAVKVWKWSKP